MTTKLEPDIYDRSYFAKLEDYYLTGVPHVHRHYEVLFRLLRPEEQDCILEAGCGAGCTAVELARRCQRVVAVDNNHLAVDSARAFITRFERIAGRIELREAELSNLPYPDGFFTKICFSEVIEHVVRPESVLEELNRVLRRGGIMVLSTWPSYSNISWFLKYRYGLGHPTDFNPQTPSGLRRLLSKAGFFVSGIELRNFYFWIPKTRVVIDGCNQDTRLARFCERYLTRGVLGMFFGSSIYIRACKR